MEEQIRFQSGELQLEGLFGRREGARGVVVTHPHPLYGGEMRNNVVQTIMEAYQGAGFSTLRFNFRGVGKSQGTYDNGDGEQEDVLSALEYLRKRGVERLHLAGYSFGVWVNAKVLGRLNDVEKLVMVSPPVDFMDFSFLETNPKIGLVVTGGRDDIAGPERVRQLAPTWNPVAQLDILPGADHFYLGFENELRRILETFLAVNS